MVHTVFESGDNSFQEPVGFEPLSPTCYSLSVQLFCLYSAFHVMHIEQNLQKVDASTCYRYLLAFFLGKFWFKIFIPIIVWKEQPTGKKLWSFFLNSRSQGVSSKIKETAAVSSWARQHWMWMTCKDFLRCACDESRAARMELSSLICFWNF